MNDSCRKTLIPLVEHFVHAAQCNDCFSKKFKKFEIAHEKVVSGGQPRRVGKNYFNLEDRICFVLLNPSGAETRLGTRWDKFMNCLRNVNVEEETSARRIWDEFQAFIRDEETKWGRGDPWSKLYYEATGIDKDDVVFVNAMLCADDEDKYPMGAIKNCLIKQQLSLMAIKLLEPTKIILSGHKVINAFLNKGKKTTLTELRNCRGKRVKRYKKNTLTQYDNIFFKN